jgi:MFS family permease
MQHTAQGWLVYRLSGSTTWLGFITFLTLFPIFLLGLWAGAVGDRHPRKPIVWAVNAAAAIQAILLGTLALTGNLTLPLLAVLALSLGVLNAFEIPNRQAFVVDLVPANTLPSAMALNSSAFNLARLIGPLLGGLLISWKGEAVCFLLNALTYAPVLVGLAWTRPPTLIREARNGNLWRSLCEGLSHLSNRPHFRSALALVATTSFFGIWFPSFLPAIAKDTHGGGPFTLGLMLSSVGLGSLIGAFRLASLSDTMGLGRRAGLGAIGFSVGLVGFPHLSSLILSMAVLFGMGYAMVTVNVGVNTLTQTLAPMELRGRIASVYTVSLLGVGPVGALLAGALADWVGLPLVLTSGGLGALSGALFLYSGISKGGTDSDSTQRENSRIVKEPSFE